MDQDKMTRESLRAAFRRQTLGDRTPSAASRVILPEWAYDQAQAAGFDMTHYVRGYPDLSRMGNT